MPVGFGMVHWGCSAGSGPASWAGARNRPQTQGALLFKGSEYAGVSFRTHVGVRSMSSLPVGMVPRCSGSAQGGCTCAQAV